MAASERRRGGSPAATLDDRLGTIESATSSLGQVLDGLVASQREQADAVVDESIDRRVGTFERGSRHFDRRVGHIERRLDVLRRQRVERVQAIDTALADLRIRLHLAVSFAVCVLIVALIVLSDR